MKRNRGTLIWGIILIIIGVVAFLVNYGWMPDLSSSGWSITLAAAGLIFFLAYLIGGWRNWPALFPSILSFIAAVAIGLSEGEPVGDLTGGLVMILVSIPFWVGFLANRQRNYWTLIPGWSLLAIGILILVSPLVEGESFASLVLFAIALPFFVIYLRNRQNWWALIPAYALTALSGILLLGAVIDDRLIPALVMWAIALPFLVVFFNNRQNWWALIPAMIMGILGLILLLITGLGDIAAGVLITLAIALPFYAIFFIRRENWWALIPAGVLTSASAAVLVSGLDLEPAVEARLSVGVILGGIALTFTLLWSLRKQYETDWAVYPALILALAAILVAIFGVRTELLWSIGLIALGVWILYRGTHPRQKHP